VSDMTDADQAQRQATAERVLYWMRRRGMTRQIFADRMGKSVSWVDKIRTGDRQLDRLSVLRHIALVLDIPVRTLIDPEEAERRAACPDDQEIGDIRAALRRYDVITNVFRVGGEPLPEPDLAKLEQAVRFGWMAFQASNYQVIGQRLADLIRDAQSAVWQLDGDARRQAQTWLAWTYQLTAATANKLGDAQLAWVAADRGIQIAEQTGDLTLIGSAARRVTHALSASHQGHDAIELATSAARRLEPHLSDADAAFASAYGMLLLKGSIAAAKLDRASDVRDFQDEALNVARRLEAGRNEHWSAFGVTNVLVHRVSALADMQAGGRVTEAAAAIPTADLRVLPRERRATHLLDVTRGYLQAGQRDQAATTLLGADQIAAGEVRCRSETKPLISELVASYPRGTTPLAGVTKLARAVGITV
jgi:transcriptional regulator with XRE-family HTH domain